MTKKRKSKFSIPLLKPSWISALFIGLGIGVFAGRNIPEARADKAIEPSYYSQEIALPGHPSSSFVIHRSNYSLAYDARNRNPAWVYEHLTAESIKGNANRSHSDFKEDEQIPNSLRATLTDYKGSGFDRGHMAPAADHRSSPEAMTDTFYLTNMCPQCPQFNRGYWAKLEKHVRDLTKEYQNVYVVTGPLYLPLQEADGKRYVKYQVIGQNDVAVPTHFFKVITLENWQGAIEKRAYILPNQEISSKIPLDQFKTTIQKVERAAGMALDHS
jgi:endonuclease G